MASQEMDKATVKDEQQQQQEEEHCTPPTGDKVVVDSNVDEVVSIELPAPQGWTKKFIPKKGGTGTPRRNEIVFIAPTGEEIKNKRQLDQYLKSHTGGPPSSDFDWGTGDTPRRSSRLSSKPKATESPESGGSSRKRQRKSSSKKEETEGGESGEDEAPKTEDDKDVEMKDAEGAKSGAEDEKAKEEAHEEAAVANTSAGSTDEKADGTKEQKESDVVGLALETSQVPKEVNKEEQLEVNKVETAQEITLPTDGKEPEDNKEESAQEIVEQPEEKKPEAVEKPLDGQLPSGTVDAMEVDPAEKGVSGNAEQKTEESKLVTEGKENQEASVQTKNQPVNPNGAQPSC